MKRARLSEEQIVAVLKEAEASAKVTELGSAARYLGYDVLYPCHSNLNPGRTDGWSPPRIGIAAMQLRQTLFHTTRRSHGLTKS